MDHAVKQVIDNIGISLPTHTAEAIANYIVHGLEPGGFVTSMLAYDLERALYTADYVNKHHYHEIAMWVRNECPEAARGSYEAVKRWCKDTDGVRSKYLIWEQLGGEHA